MSPMSVRNIDSNAVYISRDATENTARYIYSRWYVYLTWVKHLHKRIVLHRRKIWAHKTSLIHNYFIEVHVASKKVSGGGLVY